MGIKDCEYGLVLCGGRSSRMGQDKGLVSYHDKAQRYHAFELLQPLCNQVFISCNSSQLGGIESGYSTMVDLPRYSSIGPMAALLTAFTLFPKSNFLIIGCDYPFITKKEIENFAGWARGSGIAAALYNENEQLYEPLIAWYSHEAAATLMKLFEEKQYSLQRFLKVINAPKYYPTSIDMIRNIDTPEQMLRASREIRERRRNVAITETR